MRRVLGAVAAVMLGVACGGATSSGGSTPTAMAAARAELAPSGQLRMGFPSGPPFLGNQDPSSGRWKGLAITLGNALAKSLGVSLVPTQYPDAPSTYQALVAGKVDVVFAQLAPPQQMPNGVNSTGAVVSVQHTFLVRADSSLQSVSQVDSQGIRVGSNASDGHTGFLTSHLQHAHLIKMSSDDAGLAALSSGQIDAWADGRFALPDLATELPGSRILDGSFFTPMFAFSMLQARSDAATYLNAFVQSELSSGAVKHDIDQAVGKPGVLAGPAS